MFLGVLLPSGKFNLQVDTQSKFEAISGVTCGSIEETTEAPGFYRGTIIRCQMQSPGTIVADDLCTGGCFMVATRSGRI